VEEQRDYAEEAENRRMVEEERRATLAAERAERGAAWLAGQGYSLTDLGPSQYVDVVSPLDCPAGRTVGYSAVSARGQSFVIDHGFVDDRYWRGDGVSSHDLNVAWRRLIDAAHADADAAAVRTG
jgi:hypothetical protein